MQTCDKTASLLYSGPMLVHGLPVDQVCIKQQRVAGVSPLPPGPEPDTYSPVTAAHLDKPNMDVYQRKAIFEKYAINEDKSSISKTSLDEVLGACGLEGDKRKELYDALMAYDDDPQVSFDEFNSHINAGKLRKAFDKFGQPDNKDYISKEKLFEALGECGLTEEQRKESYDLLVEDDTEDPLVFIDRAKDYAGFQ